MGKTKLTNDDVLEIKKRLEAGERNGLIASSFAVDPSTISKIKTGGRRPHVDKSVLQQTGEFNIGKRLSRISSFVDYAVSNDGEVFSRKTGGWKQLPKSLSDQGYYQVYLEHNGQRHNKGVGRLLLETFIGPCPKGLETRHLDGNPLNNKLSNLTWGTSKENSQDTLKHGNRLNGEKIHQSKLTEQQVKEMLESTESSVTLEKRYPVKARQIRRIRQGVRWKHIR